MTTLNFGQIEELWDQNGGDPGWAPMAAGIAEAESGGDTGAWNQTAATGDDSVGLWQINYFGSLLEPRSAEYGAPATLSADPNAQARAAIALSNNGRNWQPWTTDRAWSAWRAAGEPADPSAQTVESWLSEAGASTGTGPGGTLPAPSSSSSTSSSGSTATTAALNVNPFDLFGIPQTVAGSAAGTVWGSVGPFLARGMLVAAGLGLGILGIYKMTNAGPKIEKLAQVAPELAA